MNNKIRKFIYIGLSLSIITYLLMFGYQIATIDNYSIKNLITRTVTEYWLAWVVVWAIALKWSVTQQS